MHSGEPMRAHVRQHKQGGFTLVAALAAMFLLALASQQVMTLVSQQAQREREAELLLIGAEYVRAIGAYYENSPGSVKVWPPSLQALTDDRRFVTLNRYLRRVYPDPITRSTEWGVVPAADGGIAGVYSQSEQQPIRNSGSALEELGLGSAQRYSDWKFVYMPKVASSATGGGTP